MKVAEEKSLYYSPSHHKLGLRDRIFQEHVPASPGGTSLRAQSNYASLTKPPLKEPISSRLPGAQMGYPNIFSTRTLNPNNEHEDSRAQANIGGNSTMVGQNSPLGAHSQLGRGSITNYYDP